MGVLRVNKQFNIYSKRERGLLLYFVLLDFVVYFTEIQSVSLGGKTSFRKMSGTIPVVESLTLLFFFL